MGVDVFVNQIQRVGIGAVSPGAGAAAVVPGLAPPQSAVTLDPAYFALVDDPNAIAIGPRGESITGATRVTLTSLPSPIATKQTPVTITGNSTQNLLNTAVPVPAGASVTIRVRVKAKLVTPTQFCAFDFLLDALYVTLGSTTGRIFANGESAGTGGDGPFTGAPGLSLAVTGAADNGAGLVRLTVPTGGMGTGATVVVAGVVGTGGLTAAANGTFTATVVDATHLDLQGSTFAGAYTGGGTVAPQATVGLTIAGNAVQVQATGLSPAPWKQGGAVGSFDFRATATSIYIYTAGGNVSGSGSGPTSTGTNITDGTATCDYVGPLAGGVPITWTAFLEAFSA